MTRVWEYSIDHLQLNPRKYISYTNGKRIKEICNNNTYKWFIAYYQSYLNSFETYKYLFYCITDYCTNTIHIHTHTYIINIYIYLHTHIYNSYMYFIIYSLSYQQRLASQNNCRRMHNGLVMASTKATTSLPHIHMCVHNIYMHIYILLHYIHI